MGAGWAWAVVAAMSATQEPQVVSPLVKVRPGEAVKGRKEARLSLARGECEAVQVVLPGRVERPAVESLTLKGPGAALKASVWREAFIDVKTPSNGQGHKGPWPDALVPVDAPGHDSKLPTVFYVEVCAPEKQEPGTYRGQLLVKAGGAKFRPVPFTAEVQPFALPATSSLPNSFGVSMYSIARGHGVAPESAESRKLLRDYGRALLEHRVSAHGMSMTPPPVRFEKGRAVLDWREYDAEMAPFLDGSLLPSGARFTSTDVRDSKQAKTDAEKTAYYRAFAEHFREKGWPAQLFFYAKDEPKPEDVPLVKAQSTRVRAAGKIPVLVTSPLDDALNGSADILTPTLNCFYPRPGPQTCRSVVEARALRKRLAGDTRVWWYQSCNSHGCNGGPPADKAVDAAYSGWASYMVDHPAPLNRAMGVLAFSSGVDGELYFDTVFAYNTKKDPWKDVFEFGGNGDGTLFYPGTPARVGPSGHQPILTLRLKHIRDGLEDYEYLRLLAELGDATFARTAARKLARTGWDINADAGEWEAVREEVTTRLRKRWAESEYAKRTDRQTPQSTP
ncbi:hypothetical protein MXAN_2638 [Myxococcus xanthus DK 1622]|uniref:Glycoside hydrolase 123 catalytic domain-containing protein n=1 Tax=Myxococcus xanthus (strain DK1622) TaxID=246197 RepID=Q1D916_MYXXD|nr:MULTISPECIES: DUF4091 domain-containing protein [Myxococcus]ABF87404.1 hypothetical protein MXAN_2638 [Myxococcus xanthus DK 1622]NOJ53715.1 DUF4091 domain-containing protein [Myxococcus xanthus]QPM82144.1 DUF4091 domain-containing protein [Myxococcus xanthus]QVW71392.1 DUF4091 domain-containing protein [Myxococcus xanthus DZ2]QZZ50363.1 hypothetical protein MyxoNM_14215 [Myxococcus xanthus]